MDHAYERILAVYMFQIGHFKYSYFSYTIQGTIKIHLQWYTAIIIPLGSITSIVLRLLCNRIPMLIARFTAEWINGNNCRNKLGE